MLIEKGAKIEKDTEEEKEEEEEIEAKVETWNEMDNLESVQDWTDLTKKLKPKNILFRMKLLSLLSVLEVALAGRDNCYKYLGVSKSETTKKIKSAYR